MKKEKVLGQVYTPQWIVNQILDEVGYSGKGILKKHILEPSCGDGAFLCEIVKRYIHEAKKTEMNVDEIASDLSTYIFGIEIDEQEFYKCETNLDKIIFDNLAENIKIDWKIYNRNSIYAYQEFIGFFDFVVGNPPYIRIHNLDLETRDFLKQNFSFSVGMIDIYLSFFEIAFKVLNSRGKLGYITPNSFLQNTSYKNFREFLQNKKWITKLIDFKANKVFQGFSTYTAITIIDKANSQEFFEYKELKNGEIKSVNTIFWDNLKGKKWAFSDKNNTDFLENLFVGTNAFLGDFFDVQYGFATLRDKIFIGEKEDIDEKYCLFNGHKIEKSILRKIVKGSKFKGDLNNVSWVLFPYQKIKNRFIVISEESLKNEFPMAYQYLLENKEELTKRDMDKGASWYEFGRSQGVQSIHQSKIVLSTLVNGEINFHKIPEDVLMYSGIFITRKSNDLEWSVIEEILKSEDFYRYIRITGKDFSGGYKSVTTKQIKEYKLKVEIPITLF